MLEGIFLAIIQAATEFLPLSSSGHLAFVSKLISEPNIFFFTALHGASLFAVIIFTRKEITHLFRFDEGYGKMWLCLIIATLPAVLLGFFFRDRIKEAFSSFLFIGIAFIFTAGILFSTKFKRMDSAKISLRDALIIGLLQALALFPGISRSGLTISAALLLGIDKEKAIKFSFLLFIPLSFGAFMANALASNEAMNGALSYLSASLLTFFLVCLVMSLIFLKMMLNIVKKGKIWVFSIYCFSIGATSILLYFLS